MATEVNQVIQELITVDRGKEALESHIRGLQKIIEKSKEQAAAQQAAAAAAEQAANKQGRSWSAIEGSFERLKKTVDNSVVSLAKAAKDFETLEVAQLRQVRGAQAIGQMMLQIKNRYDLTTESVLLLKKSMESLGQGGTNFLSKQLVAAAELTQTYDKMRRSVDQNYDTQRKLERASDELKAKINVLNQVIARGGKEAEGAAKTIQLLTAEHEKFRKELDGTAAAERARAEAMDRLVERMQKLRREQAASAQAQLKENDSIRRSHVEGWKDQVKYIEALSNLHTAFKRGSMSAAEYDKALANLNATISPHAIRMKQLAEEQAVADKKAAQAAEERSAALQRLYERMRQNQIAQSRQAIKDFDRSNTGRVDPNVGNWSDLTKYTEALYALQMRQKEGRVTAEEYEASLKRIHETMSPAAVAARKAADETKKATDQMRRDSEERSRMLEQEEKRWKRFQSSIDPVYERQVKLADGQRRINAALASGRLSMAEADRLNYMLVKSLDNVAFSMGGVIGAATSLQGIFLTLGIGWAASEIIRMADSWKLLEGRLKLVTSNSQELAQVQDHLFNVAQNTRTQYESVVQLYTKMAIATQSLNISQEQLARAMETATKAAQQSGSTVESVNASLYQFSQGLAANRLGGDELRSILEQTPLLAKALADGMGVAVGSLREMGTEGKLTADVIIKALLNVSEQVDKQFANVPITVAQSLTQVRNSILRLFGETDKEAKFTQPLIESLNELRRTIDDPAFKQAMVVWGKAFADAAKFALQAMKWLAENFEIVKAGLAGIMAYKVAGWFLSFAGGVAQAGRALASLNLAAIIPQFRVLAGAIGLITTGYVLLSSETEKAKPIQEEFASQQERMKQITEELATATGTRAEKLEEERQAMVRNAKTAVELQLAEMNRQNAVEYMQSQTGVPQDKILIEERRKERERELEILKEQLSTIEQMSKIDSTKWETIKAPKVGEVPQALPAGIAKSEFDDMVKDLKEQRAEFEMTGAAALEYKLEIMKATPEQKEQILTIQRHIDTLDAFRNAIRDKDKAQADSLRWQLTQMAEAEAQAAGQAARMIKLNELMANSTAEGLHGVGEMTRAMAAADVAAMETAKKVMQQRMEQISRIVNENAPKASTRSRRDGFSPRSDFKDWEKQMLANIDATEKMVRAYDEGAAAVDKVTDALKIENDVMRLGEKHRARVTELVNKEAEAKKRLEAAKTLFELKEEVQDLEKMADAHKLGGKAIEDAAREIEYYNAVKELKLDLERADHKAIADQIQLTMRQRDALQDLYAHQQSMRDAKDALGERELELQILGEQEHVQERILFLEQERRKIRDAYAAGSPEAKEAWDMAVAMADANQKLSIMNERMEKARGLADDIGQFLLDGLVNIDQAGRSVFEGMFEAATATARRFIANIVTEFLKQKILLPIAFQIFGGTTGVTTTGTTDNMSGLFGGMMQQARSVMSTGATQTPYGVAPGAGGMGGMPMGGGMGTPFSGMGSFGKWVGSWWNKPMFGGPAAGGPIQLYPPAAANAGGGGGLGSMLGGATWGQGVGAGMGGFFTGMGIGSMIKPGNKALGALGGAAAGALQGTMIAPGIGTIVGGIFGAIGGLFGNKNKPSNFGAGSTFDLDTRSVKDWDDKSNSEVMGTRSQLNQQIEKILDGFEEMGATFDRGLKISTSIGSRDNWKWGVGNQQGETGIGDNDKFLSGILKAVGQQSSGLGAEIAFVLANTTTDNLERLLKELNFAGTFRDTIESLKSSVSSLTSVFMEGKQEAIEFSKGIKEFISMSASTFKSEGVPASIPRFAKGTPSAPAGWALVGEEGPELVRMKGGERVLTAGQTEDVLSKTNIGGQAHFLAWITDGEANLLRSKGGGINRDGSQKFGPGGFPAFEVESQPFFWTQYGEQYNTSGGGYYGPQNPRFGGSPIGYRVPVERITAEVSANVRKQLTDLMSSAKKWFGNAQPTIDSFMDQVTPGGMTFRDLASANWDVDKLTRIFDPTVIENMNTSLVDMTEAIKAAGGQVPEALQQAHDKIVQAGNSLGLTISGLTGGGGGVDVQQQRNSLLDALNARGLSGQDYNHYLDLANIAGQGQKIDPRGVGGMPKDFAAMIDQLNRVQDAMASVGQEIPKGFESLRYQLQALEAARAAVDAQIAGNQRDLTSMEEQVQQVRGYWAGMRGALEAVGYSAEMLEQKLNEGANNAISKLATEYEKSLRQAENAAKGMGLINQVNDMLDARLERERDLVALGHNQGAAAARTWNILGNEMEAVLQNANLTNNDLTKLAQTFGLYPEIMARVNDAFARNQQAMSRTIFEGRVNAARRINPEWVPGAKVQMQSLGIDTSRVPGLTRDMQGFVGRTNSGSSSVYDLHGAMLRLDRSFNNGKVTAEQYSAMIDYVTEEFVRSREKMMVVAQEQFQASDAIRRAWLQAKSAVNPNFQSPGVQNAMLNAGINPRNVPGMTRDLSSYFGKASTGEVTAKEYVAAIERVTRNFKNGGIELEQYNGLVNEINAAFQQSGETIEDTTEQLKEFIKSLDDFLKSMDVDDLSVFGPQQKMFNARDQFRELSAAVAGGDRSKVGDLLDIAQTYRELGNEFWGGTEGYAKIDQEIRNALQGLKVTAEDDLKNAETQGNGLNLSNELLSRIQANLDLARDKTVESLNKLQATEEQFAKDSTYILGAMHSSLNSYAQAQMNASARLESWMQRTEQNRLGDSARAVMKDGSASMGRDNLGRNLGERQPGSWMTRGEYQQVARLTGYNGTFGTGEHQAWLKADPTRMSTFNAAISAANAQNWNLTNGQRNWGDPTYFAVNRDLALLGYTGDFGSGGFGVWIRQQPDAIKEEARAIIRNRGLVANFANGGVMTPWGPANLYDAGGVAYSPQVAIFGEGRKPEAYVPLEDGRTIPVTVEYRGGASNDDSALEARLARIEAALERLIQVAAKGGQGTIDGLDELLAEYRELARNSRMDKGKR